MKRKFLCYTLAASILLTNVPAVNVYADTTTRTTSSNDVIIDEEIDDEVIVIKDYDDNEYLENVGTKRGDYQVREVIPFVLPAGESITIEQIGGNGQIDLTVELKTGLSSSDVTSTVKKDGKPITVKAKEESVVYIKVPRTKFNDIALEYSMTGATTLPIYTQDQTKEATFFEIWDEVGTANAIIQNDDIIIQVPEINKEDLRDIENNRQFDNVEHLLEYYDKMIAFYDSAYGLEGKAAYNYNPGQKYLVVPELRNNGSNSVVYSEDIVRAYGSNTGVYKFLQNDQDVKNEIAKGYQGDMVRNDVSVDGIWNQIIAHYYAMEAYTNDRTYRTEYLFRKPTYEKNVYDKSLSLRGTTGKGTYTLDFFRNIFDEFGMEVFAEFNQEYRRLGMTGAHDDMTNTNMFVKYFSEYAEVDFAPYFLSYGLDVDESVISANAELPKVYYLADLVDDEDTIEYLVDRYDLASEYALIDTRVFVEDRGVNLIKGDATVYLDIDNINELSGKQVMLKNGEEEYFADVINGRAEFNDIPLGVYNVFAPMTNSGEYIKTIDSYAIVSEDDDAVVRGKYTRIDDFYINLNYDFVINNEDDETALDAKLRYVSDNDYDLTINTYEGISNPSARNDSVYGYIKVYDDKNRVVEQIELLNHTESEEDEIELQVKKGYKIHLYNSNEDNKYVNNIITGDDLNDESESLVTFEITDDGLVSDSSSVARTVTDSYIAKGKDTYFKVPNQYFNTNYRAYLANAISHLSESEQESYTNKNAQNLRVNNPKLNVNNKQITVPLNTKINYSLYATASDVEDGDISKAIESKDDKVDVTKAGTYTTILRVEDSDHNYAEETITVVVDKNATSIITGTDSNTTTNQVKPDVKITGRSPYDVMVQTIDETTNSQFNNVTNKNTVVPYYIKPDGTKSQAKFSYFDTSTDELLYVNNTNASNYQLENRTNRFVDISNNWAKSNIEFVSARGILTGVTDTQFAPKAEVSRAMTVTVLGRLSDADVSNRTSSFKDVPIGTWYTGYVNWAKTNNIISGVDETHFDPNGSITREQLAVAIDHYLTYLGYDIEKTSTDAFTDDDKISSWAKDSVYTLKSIGIVNGDTLGNYNPKSYLNRAELSAILERLVVFVVDSETEANAK